MKMKNRKTISLFIALAMLALAVTPVFSSAEETVEGAPEAIETIAAEESVVIPPEPVEEPAEEENAEFPPEPIEEPAENENVEYPPEPVEEPAEEVIEYPPENVVTPVGEESEAEEESAAEEDPGDVLGEADVLAAGGWKQINGSWHYLSDGKSVTGWKQIDGYWYFFGNDGSLATGWFQDGRKWYYTDKDGLMQTGWQQIDGEWYFFKADGSLATGWFQAGGKWYYADKNGLTQTGWKKIDGNWFCFAGSGEMLTGWKQVDGQWYFFKADGALAVGWFSDGGLWYYADKDGIMQTGWQQIDRNWYYFRGSGEMITGWQQFDGQWYFFKPDGMLAVGWFQDGSKSYYADQNGVVSDSVETSGKVGVSMPTRDLQRWNNDGYNLEAVLKNSGYDAELQFASNDVYTQLAQIEAMIDNGCEVLIIAPIEGSSLGAVLDKAAEKGVKVIAYDRLLIDNANVDYYVTFDNYSVGTVQGTYVREALDLDHAAGPFYVEFTAGDPGDNNAGFFFNGAMDVLKPYIDAGKVIVRSRQTRFDQVATPSWKTTTAQKRTEDILSAYYANGEKLDAWVCSNDSTALGVTNALSAYYTGSKWPIITGQDCDIANVKNIIAGKQAMSVFKDTRTLVAMAAKMAGQILKGQTVDVNDTETYDNNYKIVPTFLCTPSFVDANNYKEMLIDSGYYTEDQI